jgi:hypothetical protein
MKKIAILLSLITFLSQNLLVYPQKPDKVKGGHKDCTIYGYIYKSGKLIVNSKKKLRFCKYNDFGNMVSDVWYFNKDSIIDKNTYKYDDKGMLINQTCFYANDSVKSINKFKYLYDDRGYIINEVLFDSDDKVISSYGYKYDDQGNLIEKTEYYSDGSVKWRTKYKNDGNGNPVEKMSNENTSYPMKYFYKYDHKKNKIEEIYMFIDGSEYHKSIYKYDKFGNMIRGVWYDRKTNKPYMKLEYVYN